MTSDILEGNPKNIQEILRKFQENFQEVTHIKKNSKKSFKMKIPRKN